MTARSRLSQATQPADPTAATQSATKQYVDNQLAPVGTFPSAVGSVNTVGTSVYAAHADHIHKERQATLDRITALEAPAAVTLTDAATIATDASLAKFFRVTLAGDRTLGVPTNPTDAQRALWEFTASAAQRTITLTTGSTGSFELTAGLSAANVIPSGKVGFLAAVYSSSRARWTALAFRVTS